jgi:hypothetical protein
MHMEWRCQMPTSHSDAVEHAERALLGALLETNSLWPETSAISVDDFSLDSHRKVYACMATMFEDQRPVDLITLTEELARLNQLEGCRGPAYIAELISAGVVPENIAAYVRCVRNAAAERRVTKQIDLLAKTCEIQSPQKMDELRKQVQRLLDSLDASSIQETSIRHFSDIPDVLRMDFPPVDYIVPAIGIARNTITLWTGKDGDGKTFMAQAMACAVARGEAFLGMKCQNVPVLYLDLENPPYVVQDRLRSMVGEEARPDLRFWGTWHGQQPPQAGSALLLALCKETRPLLIIDPFRYFHDADENESTAMAIVMKYLRACASYGAAIVILHHPAKQEGSTGRGSSAIRGACDLAFLHSLNKESQLITLKVDKNRNGEGRSITVRADFEQGRFLMTESPYITTRNEEFAKLESVIAETPGITQNGIVKQSGMMKARVGRLLKEGRATRWQTSPGPNRSILYYPLSSGSVVLCGSENQ